MSKSPSMGLAIVLVGALTACGDSSPTEPSSQSFLGCTTMQSISVGATVSGNLTSSSCRLPDGSFVDFYELRLDATQSVTIALTSTAFDTYLIVFQRATASFIAEDDDGGGGTNSLLQLNLPAGTYVVAANSFAAGETGAYQLSVN